jgi:hypothetical protein
MLKKLTDYVTGKAPLGAKRSPKWPKVRKDFLEKNPTCAACGGTEKIEIHHLKPFHLHPELELEPSNLITLCEGKKGLNCHLVFGHLCDYKQINPDCRSDALMWKMKLAGKRLGG